MLEGWARQQSARFLRSATIDPRIRLLERFEEFSGQYPWQWSPAEGEAFIAHLRSGVKPIQMSTARTYEVTIGLFMEYLLDARYGWGHTCLERFGEAPQAVFHEGNSVLHTVEYEGDPRRRPLTYDEVQALFDALDARPGKIRASGRKGALGALRDAAVIKTVYAFGTRRTETSRLDLTDLRRNRKAPQFGNFGTLMVRFGKSKKGAPPKRRSVLTIPEMDWIVETLQHWLTEVRPQFSPGRHPALWMTERVGRLSPRSINEAFVTARQDAGLDEDLDLHCLRHSYITHLTEFGYPARFVQEQVGHSHASTTAIYMNPRELHQTGEKPQVAWSRRETEGPGSLCELAA
ncbi:tyrosine-type recombinase/integrase [Streptomyces europaeiscabiei]|uniref:tyrosine-type recombinase/integrase n=1 Tax=Streptomyces europaeiscabiei TaxID=146819 RepID=UPI0029AA7DF8|nr:tyrosine-type recombinase/integrase [Streptomyces europaeiscabiei]MDX3671962.1 tyrosine-type recombinase/integrase [Streptomyces europaeiscabiei]